MSRTYPIHLILTAACVLLLLVGCRQPELDSRWREDQIHIDGELSDWRNCPPYYINESPAVIGFCNDSDYLYLRLSTRDPNLQRLIMAGSLTIWFDPAGGKNKAFGIGFPSASQNRSRNKVAVPRGNVDEKESPHPSKQQLELRGADGKSLARLDADGPAYGIEVVMNKQNRNLLYELKLPLAVTEEQPFGIGVAADAQIGIGLITKQMQMPNKTAGQGQATGRDGKRAGGGRAGKGGGRGGQQPEPFNQWVKLQLAPAPKAVTILPQG